MEVHFDVPDADSEDLSPSMGLKNLFLLDSVITRNLPTYPSLWKRRYGISFPHRSRSPHHPASVQFSLESHGEREAHRNANEEEMKKDTTFRKSELEQVAMCGLDRKSQREEFHVLDPDLPCVHPSEKHGSHGTRKRSGSRRVRISSSAMVENSANTNRIESNSSSDTDSSPFSHSDSHSTQLHSSFSTMNLSSRVHSESRGGFYQSWMNDDHSDDCLSWNHNLEHSQHRGFPRAHSVAGGMDHPTRARSGSKLGRHRLAAPSEWSEDAEYLVGDDGIVRWKFRRSRSYQSGLDAVHEEEDSHTVHLGKILSVYKLNLYSVDSKFEKTSDLLWESTWSTPTQNPSWKFSIGSSSLLSVVSVDPLSSFSPSSRFPAPPCPWEVDHLASCRSFWLEIVCLPSSLLFGDLHSDLFSNQSDLLNESFVAASLLVRLESIRHVSPDHLYSKSLPPTTVYLKFSDGYFLLPNTSSVVRSSEVVDRGFGDTISHESHTGLPSCDGHVFIQVDEKNPSYSSSSTSNNLIWRHTDHLNVQLSESIQKALSDATSKTDVSSYLRSLQEYSERFRRLRDKSQSLRVQYERLSHADDPTSVSPVDAVPSQNGRGMNLSPSKAKSIMQSLVDRHQEEKVTMREKRYESMMDTLFGEDQRTTSQRQLEEAHVHQKVAEMSLLRAQGRLLERQCIMISNAFLVFEFSHRTIGSIDVEYARSQCESGNGEDFFLVLGRLSHLLCLLSHILDTPLLHALVPASARSEVIMRKVDGGVVRYPLYYTKRSMRSSFAKAIRLLIDDVAHLCHIHGVEPNWERPYPFNSALMDLCNHHTSRKQQLLQLYAMLHDDSPT